jgi:hypothetical protein
VYYFATGSSIDCEVSGIVVLFAFSALCRRGTTVNSSVAARQHAEDRLRFHKEQSRASCIIGFVSGPVPHEPIVPFPSRTNAPNLAILALRFPKEKAIVCESIFSESIFGCSKSVQSVR